MEVDDEIGKSSPLTEKLWGIFASAASYHTGGTYHVFERDKEWWTDKCEGQLDGARGSLNKVPDVKIVKELKNFLKESGKVELSPVIWKFLFEYMCGRYEQLRLQSKKEVSKQGE